MSNKDGSNTFDDKEPSRGKINSFEDLLAWKLAFEIAKQVYASSNHFPDSERYGLTAQVRRSASSIPANIAEGFGRYTYKEYLRFLVYARGSIAETQSHLMLAFANGFLSTEEFEKLNDLCRNAVKTLQGLMRHLRNLMGSSYISEPAAAYEETGPDSLEVSDDFPDY